MIFTLYTLTLELHTYIIPILKISVTESAAPAAEIKKNIGRENNNKSGNKTCLKYQLSYLVTT